jgi:outer membrane protein assembly factor BamB
MNNRLKSSLLLAISGTLLLLGSCKKDKTIVNSVKSAFTNFSQWRQSLAVPAQKFRLDMSTGGTIRGDRGYEFTLRPGTLVDGSNNPITGNVDIELIEVTNAYEMMATGAGTLANDGILGSVGMFSLNISQNGQPVNVNRSQPIQAMVTANPNASMQDVRLFSGNVNDTTFDDPTVQWREQNDSIRFNADSLRDVWDSIQKSFIRKRCIRFELNFLSWCNLDKYWNNPNGEAIVVHIPGTADHLDTKVFMYIEQENLKGLVPMFFNGRGANDQRVFSSNLYKLPLGWNIRIIVVTRDKDYNLFYQTRIITNATGAVHEFKDLKSVSDFDLEAFFKGL